MSTMVDAHGGFELIQTKLKVEGNDNEVVFSDLSIHQQLADVNTFSFIWRQEEGEPSLSGHVAFYKKYLSKEVSISIKDFNFKGFIDSIKCVRQDELGVDYEISGTGQFGKLNEVPECNSFYKKTLDQIFRDLNKTQGTKLVLQPKNTSEIFYTVQYNQTTFEFYKMLATRYGEWLYYTGTELVLGPSNREAVTLKLEVDVQDLVISGKSRRATTQGVGYDHFKGEIIKNAHASGSFGSGLVAASAETGDKAFGGSHSPGYYSNAANTALLKDLGVLQQKAAAANSVRLSGISHNTKMLLGGKIKLVNRNNGSEGEYIITQISHTCQSPNNYLNEFVAAPAEIEVPPYTDPLVFPTSRAQPAFVVDNEDNDGLDRIKVRFPWQKDSEQSPWISVVTPHAGKDKGIRFLPEVGEEVLVGFIDNNAERPFVLGAVHTEKNKSGDDMAGNKQKIIGTQSGRRLEIDEENQLMQLTDNFKGKTPKNVLRLTRDDKQTQIMGISMKDDKNASVIQLNNADSVKIGLQENDAIILEILLEKNGKKLTIHSKGSIEINADQSISLNSDTININASQELKLEGKSKGVDLSGMKIAIDATSTMEVKGVNTKVEGTAKLELSSAAMASMEAALVKIN